MYNYKHISRFQLVFRNLRTSMNLYIFNWTWNTIIQHTFKPIFISIIRYHGFVWCCDSSDSRYNNNTIHFRLGARELFRKWPKYFNWNCSLVKTVALACYGFYNELELVHLWACIIHVNQYIIEIFFKSSYQGEKRNAIKKF